MNNADLLEDVVLALVVAWMTVAALYVGWRTGRAPRRRLPGGARDGRSAVDALEARHDAGAGLPAGQNDWERRLEAEETRCTRYGSPAAVVAIRLGQRHESRGPRTTPAVPASSGAAAALARHARASDVVSITEDGTIRTLLVETTDAGARRFVDRISGDLATAPDMGGIDIVCAWAATAPDRDLRAADRLAAARLRGATSGWLRSLAVRRTTHVTLDGEDLDQGSRDPRPSVD